MNLIIRSHIKVSENPVIITFESLFTDSEIISSEVMRLYLKI